MKKLLLSITVLSSSLMTWAQNGQLQNGGFESWTTTTLYDFPIEWTSSNQEQFYGTPTVIKSTDAQLGSYSTEIRSVAIGAAPDTAFGYVFLGATGGAGPSSGTPYTAAFNTVKFQYKCNLPESGDSVYMYFGRFIGGGLVEMAIFPAFGGVQSGWTQGTIPVSVTPQEELFIGFVIGDPNNNLLCAPGSWARIDNVQLFNNATQTTDLPNPSFETWSSNSTETCDYWFTLNQFVSQMGFQNAVKTTDAYAGSYAMEMTTNFNPPGGDTIPSFISVGLIDVMNPTTPFQPIPYNASPTTLSGAYKYAAVNGDQAAIQAVFYENGNPIGTISEPLTNQSTYTTFSVPVTLTGTPDSLIFIAFSGNNPGSVLKLDELSLSGGNVGLDEFKSMNLSIYPNPANDKVMVKLNGTFGYELINVYGTVVASASNLNNAIEIDLTQFTSGTYLIRLTNASTTETHSLVIR